MDARAAIDLKKQKTPHNRQQQSPRLVAASCSQLKAAAPRTYSHPFRKQPIGNVAEQHCELVRMAMIIKYDGAMLNGAMEGRGRAEYGDGEVGTLSALVTALDARNRRCPRSLLSALVVELYALDARCPWLPRATRTA